MHTGTEYRRERGRPHLLVWLMALSLALLPLLGQANQSWLHDADADPVTPGSGPAMPCHGEPEVVEAVCADCDCDAGCQCCDQAAPAGLPGGGLAAAGPDFRLPLRAMQGPAGWPDPPLADLDRPPRQPGL